MKKIISDLGSRLYETINWLGHKIPPFMLRTISLPVDYQSKTIDGFAYESARMINTAFGFIHNNKVLGDYAEFGVYQGKTFIEAFRAGQRYGMSGMKFWAYDSFEGLPEVKGQDKEGVFYTGEFAFPKNKFKQTLEHYGVDLQKVEIIEGFYEKTLSKDNADKKNNAISIAWIDCDLYESTIPVLEFLTDNLSDGAVLIFDDWFCFNARPDKGEQLACREWLEKNPDIYLTEYQKFHWAGNSFIFHRKVKI